MDVAFDHFPALRPLKDRKAGLMSHGELSASGTAAELSGDGALLAASYLGGDSA